MRKRFGKVVLDTETAEFLGWWVEGGGIAYAAYLQDKVLFARKTLPNGREDLFPSRPTRVRDMAGNIHALCNHITAEAYIRHIRGTYLERAFTMSLSIAA